MRNKGERLFPDVATPPGEHLADTLREVGMSQSELARKMGRPQQAINEIVRGVKAITAETALQLEQALGISAETWMNLESNYRLTKARLVRAKNPLRPRVQLVPVAGRRIVGVRRRSPEALFPRVGAGTSIEGQGRQGRKRRVRQA